MKHAQSTVLHRASPGALFQNGFLILVLTVKGTKMYPHTDIFSCHWKHLFLKGQRRTWVPAEHQGVCEAIMCPWTEKADGILGTPCRVSIPFPLYLLPSGRASLALPPSSEAFPEPGPDCVPSVTSMCVFHICWERSSLERG